MQEHNAISKELLSHLVMLEAEHQSKVLSYIKKLLGQEGLLDEMREMNLRAEASEQDIVAGRIKKGSTFKKDFEAWQKKKRSSMKL